MQQHYQKTHSTSILDPASPSLPFSDLNVEDTTRKVDTTSLVPRALSSSGPGGSSAPQAISCEQLRAKVAELQRDIAFLGEEILEMDNLKQEKAGKEERMAVLLELLHEA